MSFLQCEVSWIFWSVVCRHSVEMTISWWSNSSLDVLWKFYGSCSLKMNHHKQVLDHFKIIELAAVQLPQEPLSRAHRKQCPLDIVQLSNRSPQSSLWNSAHTESFAAFFVLTSCEIVSHPAAVQRPSRLILLAHPRLPCRDPARHLKRQSECSPKLGLRTEGRPAAGHDKWTLDCFFVSILHFDNDL